MIFDTDVLIWALKDNERANALIDRTSERLTTIVNYLELIRGARDKAERRLIRAYIHDGGFQMLPLSEQVGNRAAVYMEEIALKTQLSLGDALVAAIAVEHRKALCTANIKHFRDISELTLKAFRPV